LNECHEPRLYFLFGGGLNDREFSPYHLPGFSQLAELAAFLVASRAHIPT
jgi:hypothetical protein